MILKDKVVVVSGIGPGLGQELAYGAAEEGAKVVLAARTESKLKEVEAEIKSQVSIDQFYILYYINSGRNMV